MILIISTFTLYQDYKNQILEQSNDINEKLLKQAAYYTQSTLYWANSFIYQLYTDDNIYNLMYSTNKSLNNRSAGILKLNQVSSVIPLTQSILYL